MQKNLEIPAILCYNKDMETGVAETRNAETVTISRAEYEALKVEHEALKEENAELTRKLE